MKALQFFVTATLSFLAYISLAIEIPQGNVSGVWTLTDSPYIIQGNIRIPEGQSLTIQPGVQVLFNGPYALRAIGSLNAIGAPGDSISFSSLTNSPNWKGIKLDSLHSSSDTVRLRFCKLSLMGGGNIAIINTDKFILEDSRMFNNSGHFAGCFYTFNSSFQARRNYFHNNSTASQSDGGVFYVRDAAPIIEYNTFRDNSATYSGGAISCWRQNGPSTPIIRYNMFISNYAGSGGAIILHDNTVATIEHNTFLDNEVFADGGAIWIGYVQAGIPIIENNVFSNNYAPQKGGAVRMVSTKGHIAFNAFDNNNSLLGGAIYMNDESVVSIDNCSFENNTATQGGAVHANDAVQCNFNNDYFNNNSASVGGAVFFSSAIFSTFNNCNFVFNQADFGAALRLTQNSHPSFFHCNFSKNLSPDNAAISLYWNADPTFVNSIFWENTTNLAVQDYIWNYCEPTFDHCLVQGGLNSLIMGTSSLAGWYDVIDDNPLFLGPFVGQGLSGNGNNGNWHLNLDSPCIDAGISTEYPLPDLDFEGDIRIQNGAPDLGIFEGGEIYLGPVISQHPVSQSICPGQNINLSVEFDGTAPILINWYHEDNPNTSIGSFNSLTIEYEDELPGNYYCVISNDAGSAISNYASIQWVEPFDVNFTTSASEVCQNDSVELNIVISGPVQLYSTYLNNTTLEDLDVWIQAGNYTIVVVDTSGCEAISNFSIAEFTTPQYPSLSNTNTSCTSCTDGSLQFDLSPSFTYLLNEIVILSSPVSNLGAATYTLTVCSSDGCCIDGIFEISAGSAPGIADINGDGSVTIDDFLTLLGNFGCVGENCSGDINQDGVVNVADLIGFLGFI